MQYSFQFKNIHSTQINHTFAPLQQLSLHDYKCGIYQGEYFKNHRQGKGVFYWYSGQIYIGEWMKDTIEGQGTLYFPYGGNFVGFFHNNKAEGAGILTLLDGSRIAGNWKYGRIEGNFVRYDAESDEWIILNSRNYYNINKQSSNYSYAMGHQQQHTSQYQKQINQIYESIKQKIDTPYYRQMTERLEGHNLQANTSFSQPNTSHNQMPNIASSSNGFNQVSLAEVDKFKIKLQQLDDEIFYHGIVRGSRPDGMGIMFSMNGRFSVRGKFANTKLNGPGRVELENGEIYDGVFRNGIISSGFYYNAKFNSYIAGTFRGEGDVKLDIKGKGYPYKLALGNKMKAYPCMMIYKNTSEELIFLVQNDIKLLKMLDISKYMFSSGNDSQPNTEKKIHSANTFGFDNNTNSIEDSQDISLRYSQIKQPMIIEDEEEHENDNHKYSVSVPQQDFVLSKQNQKVFNQNFDEAFEEFIQAQQLDPMQSKLISQEYYSRQFENEEEHEHDTQFFNRNQEETNNSKDQNQYTQNTNSNFSSGHHDKQYVKKLLLHKINVEGMKEMGYEDLQRLNQISEEIDKENLSTPSQLIGSKITSSQILQEKAEYYLNKARYLKLKLKLKEETQYENRDEENRSRRLSSIAQVNSQQMNQRNMQHHYHQNEEDNDHSPEFIQTVDKNKAYSLAVPAQFNKHTNNQKSQFQQINSQQKVYHQKMDTFLNTSQDYNDKQLNSDRNYGQSSQSSDLNSQTNQLNQRKFSFKKNQKDIQINVQNASYENSPQQNHSQENDCNTIRSQDQIQEFGGYEDQYLNEENANSFQDSNQLYSNQYNNLYN